MELQNDSNPEGTETDATSMWEAEMDSEDGAIADVDPDEADTDVDADNDVDEDEEEDSDVEDEQDESEETEEQESYYSVQVDGEEFEVTLDEALKGYMRNESFTRKSQAVAEERRQFESESQAQRDQAIALLEQLQAQSQQHQPQHNEEYWENLRETDPTRWMMERDALRETQLQEQMRSQQLEQLKAQQDQERQQEFEQYVESQRHQLLELVPEWQDTETASSERQLILEYGQKVGFSMEELNNAFDARAVATMRKAALYDLGQQKREKLKPVVRKSIKPGTKAGEPGQLRRGKAEKRLKQSGKVEDFASYLENMM